MQLYTGDCGQQQPPFLLSWAQVGLKQHQSSMETIGPSLSTLPHVGDRGSDSRTEEEVSKSPQSVAQG